MNMGISTRFAVLISGVFLCAGLIIIVLVNKSMRRQALIEAESKAMIILDHNLATHTYFTHDLKPGLFEFADQLRREDYFEPTWMSSTFAVRQVENYVKPLSEEDYYYKECAVNARSPANEADDYEREFIEKINADQGLSKLSAVRHIDGEPFFVTLRRGEMMEQSCLRCHSTPGEAPGDMVALYGDRRSFNRELGEVVSAVSIRIPLARAFAQANRISLKLSGALVLLLIVLLVVVILINRHQIITPIKSIRNAARSIVSEEGQLGEEIPLPGGRELAEMTAAFNTMSVKLRESFDTLEDRVRERTKDLQEALGKVKTLSGFLPICASCKKIRDDKGYWSQIETYVRDHSEAEFSHSICPECARKLYPEIMKGKGEPKGA